MSATAVPNLSALDFWHQPHAEREAAFKLLRDEHPLSWQPQPETTLMPATEGSGGYWAAVRFDDIRTVSRDPEHFISGRGVMLEDVPQEMLDAAQSFLAMDGVDHRSLRGLVQAGFSPRTVRHLEDGVRADVDTILDSVAECADGGSADFVEVVAKQLPLMTIMRMLGVPEEDRERLVHQADGMVSWNDPDFVKGREPLTVIAEAIGTLHAACLELCEARRREPGEDLLSALVHAEVEGEQLTDAQIASFFVLLCVAGNDTTRHTTSHAMLALCEHPDERVWLAEDLPGRIDTAVEEFVRWASPVMTFRRTVAKPVELRGEELEPGQKVVMFYPSGNRDERAIDRPYDFDLSRDPNRHLGFGGGGPHFCMGSALAKLQLKVLFTGLLTRFPDLQVGDPAYLVGNFVNGISRMPFSAK